MEKEDIIVVATAVAMVAATGAMALKEAKEEAAGHPFADSMEFIWAPDEPGQGDNVSFESMSKSPNGDITKWIWDWGDQNSPEKGRGEKTHHHFEKPGNYEVTLKCVDEIGRIEELTQKVNIKRVTERGRYGTQVVADAGCSLQMVEGSEGTFTFKAVPKRAGEALRFSWDFDDLNGANRDKPDGVEPNVEEGSVEVKHTYPKPGMYIVTLWVEDPDGYWDDATLTVKVLAPPKAAMEIPNPEPYVKEPVLLDGSDSEADNQDVVSYVWDLGDGNTSEGEEPFCEHAYQLSGTYTVTLTVTDEVGGEDTTEAKIKVIEPPTS